MATTTKEPVAIGAAVGSLIPLILGFTQAFNVFHPTETQIGALTSLYAGVLVVLTALSRSKVTPTS